MKFKEAKIECSLAESSEEGWDSKRAVFSSEYDCDDEDSSQSVKRAKEHA
jgi:hypothetical protein